MASPSSWIADVVIHCPGCPEILAEKKIIKIADEFCRKTYVWEHTPAPIDIVAEQGAYDLTLPDNSELVDISSALLDDRTIQQKPRYWLDQNYYGWRTAVGFPAFIFMPDKTSVQLVPAPQDATEEELQLVLVLTTGLSAAAFPDILSSGDYFDAIVSGAVAEIGEIHGRAWSGLVDVVRHREKYRAAISNAKFNKAYNPTHEGLAQQDYFSW